MSDTKADTQQADPQPGARESKRRPTIDLTRIIHEGLRQHLKLLV